MRKIIMIAIALVTLLASVPVMAAQTTIDTEKECRLRIEYFDDVDASKPISKAMFQIVKIAEINSYGGYTSLIPGKEIDAYTDPEDLKVSSKDGSTLMTSENGVAEMTIEQGMYLVKEIKPAEGHNASKPFLISAPYTKGGEMWEYNVTVSPKASKKDAKKQAKKTPAPSKKASSRNNVTKNSSTATSDRAANAKTGDETQFMYLIGIMIMAYMVVFAAIRHSKKENENA